MHFANALSYKGLACFSTMFSALVKHSGKVTCSGDDSVCPTPGEKHQVVAIPCYSLPAVLQLVSRPHFGLLCVIGNVVEAHCYVVDKN